tara:strand:- start:43 stop:1095 length:1053 start_codon:yes stop_codon:yes gene_type:complete
MAYTTINKSSSFQNQVLYTGNGSTQSVTGVGFQPDWTWCKQRNTARNHGLFDAVRGVTKILYSNDSSGQGTAATSLTSFNSDGFSCGGETETNENGGTYVAWNWKAGTAVSGDTGGSGTYKSYTGSVNATAGFSIIKYTGNGTNGMTVPHHLGAVPKMIIVKRLDSGSWNWQVYHTSLGATKYLMLNQNNFASTSSSRWYDVEPTSSVFTLGNDTDVNINDATFIAYSFSEVPGHSKFAKYTGNGDVDGNFIYLGFKPSFFLVKRITDGAESWVMFDNKRQNSYNTVTGILKPNLSEAETKQTGGSLDFLSNGVKLRNTDGTFNNSGKEFIYMAFGQTLVGTNNIPNNAR